MQKPVLLFYSYSHKDEKLRDELEAHLVTLKDSGLIEGWHDRKILAGQEWDRVININLESAEIILLLISSDFLASRYIKEVEATLALERHKLGQARLIPVILRPVSWKLSPFASLQALPSNAKPVTKWARRDDAFVDVCEGIMQVVLSMREEPPTVPGPTTLAAKVQNRILDVAMPEKVRLEKSFAVLAMVRFEESGGLKVFLSNRPEYGMASQDVSSTTTFPVEFPVDAVSGTAGPVTLTLKIDAPECDPPSQIKTLTLSPGGDTQPRLFLMSPVEDGNINVGVELYQGETYLAGALLTAEVMLIGQGVPSVNVVSRQLARRDQSGESTVSTVELAESRTYPESESESEVSLRYSESKLEPKEYSASRGEHSASVEEMIARYARQSEDQHATLEPAPPQGSQSQIPAFGVNDGPGDGRRLDRHQPILGGIARIAAIFLVISTIAAIIIPNLLTSRRSSNEGSAVSILRTVGGAQESYKSITSGDRYGTLEQLGETHLIDETLINGEKHGYRLNVTPGNDGRTFEATAEPLTPAAGNRSFYTNESGSLYVLEGPHAGTRDDPGELIGR